MLGRLSALDMHPKLVSDFAARTSMGGALSLAALAVALALAASEAVWFATPARIENQTVDSMRAAHIRLVWDVTFPSTPCAALSMDVTDTAGVHKLPVQGMVSYKRRLSESGRAIGGAERAGMNTLKSKDELLALSEAQAQAKKSNIEGGCGSCYGAGEADECCNSCDDVREAYRFVRHCQSAGHHVCTRPVHNVCTRAWRASTPLPSYCANSCTTFACVARRRVLMVRAGKRAGSWMLPS